MFYTRSYIKREVHEGPPYFLRIFFMINSINTIHTITSLNMMITPAPPMLTASAIIATNIINVSNSIVNNIIQPSPFKFFP